MLGFENGIDLHFPSKMFIINLIVHLNYKNKLSCNFMNSKNQCLYNKNKGVFLWSLQKLHKLRFSISLFQSDPFDLNHGKINNRIQEEFCFLNINGIRFLKFNRFDMGLVCKRCLKGLHFERLFQSQTRLIVIPKIKYISNTPFKQCMKSLTKSVTNKIELDLRNLPKQLH